MKWKVSAGGILEVMRVLEGILEVGGGLGSETVLFLVFQWVFVLCCADLQLT